MEFIKHELLEILAYMYVEVMGVVKSAPRTVSTEDSIYAYDCKHDPIVIASFAHNGFRLTCDMNYLEVTFDHDKVNISQYIDNEKYLDFLSLCTSFLIDFEHRFTTFNKNYIRSKLAHFFDKLPFDH